MELMRCALIIIIFLVMWVDDYSPDLGLFSARCDYLKPSWTDIRHRIIDVGFLGNIHLQCFSYKKCRGPPPSPPPYSYLSNPSLIWNCMLKEEDELLILNLKNWSLYFSFINFGNRFVQMKSKAWGIMIKLKKVKILMKDFKNCKN